MINPVFSWGVNNHLQNSFNLPIWNFCLSICLWMICIATLWFILNLVSSLSPLWLIKCVPLSLVRACSVPKWVKVLSYWLPSMKEFEGLFLELSWWPEVYVHGHHKHTLYSRIKKRTKSKMCCRGLNQYYGKFKR